MADYYSLLTEAEKAYWDIYTRLRELSDWPAFTDGQDGRRAGALSWLQSQRKEIYRQAEAEPNGWDKNNRRERWTQLKDNSLYSGTCRRLTSLPTNGGTDTEKVQIKERCMWWTVSSVDDQTKNWRNSNSSWLTERRKKVWHLGEDEGWNTSNRKVRYDNLCIATKTGSAYDNWAKTHDTTTGKTKPPPAPTPAPTSSRQKAVDNCRKYLGVSENPPNSNRGEPQPSDWERRVYGGTGVPWCACFSTCMAWDAGCKGSSSASVNIIMNMAKQKQGIFRGWTTDPSKVMRGDMPVIGCDTCHIGMCVDNDDACHTIEGNTSPGSEGSQYNGGCVAEKRRSRSEIIGWALVDYPD